jgi:uncharacterized membrane protein
MARPRLDSVDLLRGMIMVLMALDHVRDFFPVGNFDPLDLGRTTPALFLTRWITHLCAPTCVFLAGTALALSIERRVARGIDSWEIDRGILVRGAIIVLFDITVISLGIERLSLSVRVNVARRCVAPSYRRQNSRRLMPLTSSGRSASARRS